MRQRLGPCPNIVPELPTGHTRCQRGVFCLVPVVLGSLLMPSAVSAPLTCIRRGGGSRHCGPPVWRRLSCAGAPGLLPVALVQTGVSCGCARVLRFVVNIVHPPFIIGVKQSPGGVSTRPPAASEYLHPSQFLVHQPHVICGTVVGLVPARATHMFPSTWLGDGLMVTACVRLAAVGAFLSPPLHPGSAHANRRG
jgi:hypothetical protein